MSIFRGQKKEPGDERSIFPFRCAIGDLDPAAIHYDVRFVCHRTGREYCYRHAHYDACCKPLHLDLIRENDEVARTYVLGLQKCPYCSVPLPPDLKPAHLSACIKDYIKGFKKRQDGRTMFISQMFVPERDLEFQSPRDPVSSPAKERVVQFEEEP